MRLLSPSWLHWPQTQTLIAAFAAQENSLRFVGGAVRDALIGREVVDVDAATILPPDATMALLEKSGIRAIPTGLVHGTVTAVIDGKHFEITTLRRDVTTDGRHAIVSYTTDWKEDASRRDFTMNALYLSTQGELFDYFEGVVDLRAGMVRFIGDASARIAEDYLRILRFFRFYAWYGKNAPDSAALAACRERAAGVNSLSAERIHNEMMKLFGATPLTPILQYMHEVGVLSRIALSHHELPHLQALEHIGVALSPLLKLAALVSDEAMFSSLVRRWKISNADARAMEIFMEYSAHITPDLSLLAQKKIRRTLGAEAYYNSVLLAFARYGAQRGWEKFASLLQVMAWQPPKFPITGDDLIARGIAPGKAMGALLQRLEDAWENSDYHLRKEELLAKI